MNSFYSSGRWKSRNSWSTRSGVSTATTVRNTQIWQTELPPCRTVQPIRWAMTHFWPIGFVRNGILVYYWILGSIHFFNSVCNNKGMKELHATLLSHMTSSFWMFKVFIFTKCFAKIQSPYKWKSRVHCIVGRDAPIYRHKIGIGR